MTQTNTARRATRVSPVSARRVAVLLIMSLAGARSLSAQDLVLTNARILDPVSRTETRGALWIENGVIVGSGPRAPESAKGDRVDLSGKWVIPGLVDMHVHSFGNVAPPRIFDGKGIENTAIAVLRAGVTAFLDLFNVEDYILGLRNKQRVGAARGADIFAAGPCFTATRGHCSEYGIPTRIIDSPAVARQQLAQLAPKKPDVIKVVYDHADYGPGTLPTIDKATLEALVTAARDSGFKTVVHVGTWQDVRDAVNAGVAAITHVPRDSVVPADIPPLMLAHHTFHIPTLAVHTDFVEFVEHPELLDTPLARALSSDTIRAGYRNAASAAASDPRMTRSLERQRESRARILESVRRLHAAGIPMMTGTDAGNLGTLQGYSVHRELIRLVQAGLSPWEALAAATTRPGEFLGRKWGVRPGDIANLVVLEASPISDIANTQRIALVVLHGKLLRE